MIKKISILKKIDEISRINKISLLISIDILINLSSTWLAFFFLLDHTHQISSFLSSPSNEQITVFMIFLCVTSIFFYFFKVYNSITKYLNLNSLIQIALASFSIILITSIILIYLAPYGVPRSISILQPLIFFSMIIFVRLSIRNIFSFAGSNNQKSIIIYGAGSAGLQFYNSISQNSNYKILYFIDDDKKKQGLKIDNIDIIPIQKAKKLIIKNDINLILLCIPSINIYAKRKIINYFSDLRVKIKILPGLETLINNKVLYEDFLDVGLDELLERDSKIDSNETKNEIQDSVILVTGAGGSIGSEICKQVLVHHPKKLILVDNSEFNLYSITNKINSIQKSNDQNTEVVSKLVDIVNLNRLEIVFKEHLPNLVFHAAAYKHLPIVEENIIEAVINNVYGTKNVIEAGIKYKIRKFLLISTDKAVRATSAMGLTKRLSELLVQAYSDNLREKAPTLSMVRFGNVINSSGSIIPLFRNQINQGGPITITHPDVTRYFMTIPEAVSLVLYSMYISKGGEVFVLKMGKPVKILDIAKKMISFSGLKEKSNEFPDGDIEIKYIGLRKGEKIHEELFFESIDGKENVLTDDKPIMIEKEKFIPFPELEKMLKEISILIDNNSDKELLQMLKAKIT